MEACVLKYPLQHMHMEVKTAISCELVSPFCAISRTMPVAAPAEPSAVIGTAMDSEEAKPKSGCRMKFSFSAMRGSNAMPS